MRDTATLSSFSVYAHTSMTYFTLTLTACASFLHRYEWVFYLGEGKGTALWGPISQWDTSSVKDMQNSFSSTRDAGGNDCGGCNLKAELFNADISEWITSAVTDMSGLFIDARAFTGSLAKWNVGSPRRVRRGEQPGPYASS